MLRIYKAPNGYKFQYEEGQQPADHVLAEPEGAKPKAAPRKRRTAANKARTADNK